MLFANSLVLLVTRLVALLPFSVNAPPTNAPKAAPATAPITTFDKSLFEFDTAVSA
jgi:hypothetical protein